MSSVKVTDNTDEALSALESAVERGLEIIGGKAETYAKDICPVNTGRLRGDITHKTDPAEKAVTIGSNVEYAPYVELGTGPYFVPPPEWIHNGATQGRGIGHSFVHPRPFLRPAIEQHTDEYKYVFESELKRG